MRLSSHFKGRAVCSPPPDETGAQAAARRANEDACGEAYRKAFELETKLMLAAYNAPLTPDALSEILDGAA